MHRTLGHRNGLMSRLSPPLDACSDVSLSALGSPSRVTPMALATRSDSLSCSARDWSAAVEAPLIQFEQVGTRRGQPGQVMLSHARA